MGKRKEDDDVRRSRNVHETNQWVTAQKGQRFAPGTYVDSQGVLRAVSDNSCAVWHHTPKQRAEFGLSGRCERKGITPAEIVYDPSTGAPWCDQCWPYELERQAEEAKKRLEQTVKNLFGEN